MSVAYDPDLAEIISREDIRATEVIAQMLGVKEITVRRVGLDRVQSADAWLCRWNDWQLRLATSWEYRKKRPTRRRSMVLTRDRAIRANRIMVASERLERFRRRLQAV